MTADDMRKYIYQVGLEAAVSMLAQIVHELELKFSSQPTEVPIQPVADRKE